MNQEGIVKIMLAGFRFMRSGMWVLWSLLPLHILVCLFAWSLHDA